LLPNLQNRRNLQPVIGKQTRYPENAKMEIIVIAGVLICIGAGVAFWQHRCMRAIALSRYRVRVLTFAFTRDHLIVAM